MLVFYVSSADLLGFDNVFGSSSLENIFFNSSFTEIQFKDHKVNPLNSKSSHFSEYMQCSVSVTTHYKTHLTLNDTLYP